MTSEQCKKLLPLMQAFADGKTIQYKRRDGIWVDDEYTNFSPDWEYRIKPEPMVIEVWVSPDGNCALSEISRGDLEQFGWTKKTFIEVIK